MQSSNPRRPKRSLAWLGQVARTNGASLAGLFSR
jgi:hypothetical protein